ncbi:MAG: glycogen synthase GlgA [Clostridia bacterium]|nr:glycogen synthase GlgA [Clostridia bacterium]
MSNLKILIVSPEVDPFAKTGGLADVAGSLPKALARHGMDVRIIMPKYKNIQNVDYLMDLPVEMDGHLETAIIKYSTLPVKEEEAHLNIPVYFIDNYKYFYRGGLYGHPDDGARFNFFVKAILSALPRMDFKPDIIHCNDWQSSLLPLFLKVKYEDEPFYRDTATIFTIHNLHYQGRFPKDILTTLNLNEKRFFNPEELEFWGQVNFMKGGIIYADLINTVSNKYSLEIQTPEFGEGLDGLLRKRSQDLYGIVNGIDYHKFNPETDENIYKNYSLDTIENKIENKYRLQEELGLPRKDVPVISLISRLVAQKGLDLVGQIMNDLLKEDVQFILLGTGEDYYQQMFSQIKVRYKDKAAIIIGFDPVLAQKIYAGSDIFLMPSKFEPCGLSQLISLRYGTIPVVHATGGLEDTIIDFPTDPEKGNGFSFKNFSVSDFWITLQRALDLFNNHPDQWRKIISNAMTADFSWDKSAKKYISLYEKALEKRKKDLLAKTG